MYLVQYSSDKLNVDRDFLKYKFENGLNDRGSQRTEKTDRCPSARGKG